MKNLWIGKHGIKSDKTIYRKVVGVRDVGNGLGVIALNQVNCAREMKGRHKASKPQWEESSTKEARQS